MSEPLRVRWETRLEDVLESFEAIDYKNHVNGRRKLHLLGIFLVLALFVPDLVKDPGRIMAWVMIFLALALLAVTLVYPRRANRSFAEKRVRYSPDYLLEITGGGLHVEEGGGAYDIPFSGGIRVYEYKRVLAVSYDGNRSIAIPVDQLDAQTLEAVRGALRAGLEERYERVETDCAPRGLFGGKKG